MNRLQGHGSADSYGHRYLKCGVFNLQIVKDIDGQTPAQLEPISMGEVASLNYLLEQTGADRARFLGYFKLERVEDMAKGRLNEARRLLERKRGQA